MSVKPTDLIPSNPFRLHGKSPRNWSILESINQLAVIDAYWHNNCCAVRQ